MGHQEELKDSAQGEIIFITGEEDSDSRADPGVDNEATDPQAELLRKRIEDVVDKSNVVRLNISDSDNSDTALIAPSSKTIQAFCDKLYSFLTVKIDQIIDAHAQQLTSLPFSGKIMLVSLVS